MTEHIISVTAERNEIMDVMYEMIGDGNTGGCVYEFRPGNSSGEVNATIKMFGDNTKARMTEVLGRYGIEENIPNEFRK